MQTHLQTASNLRKAKALISNPENWNQDGGYSADEDSDSDCLCAQGAVGRAMGIPFDKLVVINILELSALEFALPKHLSYSVDEYNDLVTTTHLDIMNLFDKAISYEKHQHVKHKLPKL